MINLREIILGALMDIVEEEQYSHIVLKDVLEKYQYLDKRDRAFMERFQPDFQKKLSSCRIHRER